MDVEIEDTVPAVAVSEDNNDSLPRSCPLCKKGFDKIVPKLLPCLHSFCQPCLEDKLKEQREEPQTSSNGSRSHATTTSRLKCPKCGQEFLVPNRGIPSLIDNQFILEVVAKPSGESQTAFVCTSCEDNSSSTSYCLNCTEWLCDACVQAHQRVRVTKDHEIKSREELKVSLQHNGGSHGRTERSLYCHKHPSEKLKLFCANCERLTCRDCQLLEHKDHKYQFVNEAASRYREYFRKRLAVLGEKIGPLAESIENVQNSTKHLDHKADVVANEIKNSSAEIIKAVKQRESVLLNELKALVHFKSKMLTKQSKDLHLMQEILSHNYEFAKHAVMQGSDVSLLYSKRQLGSRIQNLLSLKYRVTPVAHSDLKFVTEAVKLCNSISKAGSVMTPSNQPQRISVSPGNNMSNRNPSMPLHHQNGPHTKANPLHSLNAFSSRQMPGALPAHVPNNSHKPSSKVYPNVVTSQVPGLGVANGIRPGPMPFMNTGPMLNQQLCVLPRLLNAATGLTSSVSTSTGYYSTSSVVPGVSSVRMAPQPDGAIIPLHHMENSSKIRQSPPTYEKSVVGIRRTSSTSPGNLDNTSCQMSSHGNVFNNTPREVRRDSSVQATHGIDHVTIIPSRGGTLTTNHAVEQPTIAPLRDGTSTSSHGIDHAIVTPSPDGTTTHAVDHPTLVPSSSPKLNQPSPKVAQLSPSPLSPSSLAKPSPNPSQTSVTPPQVSPKPQTSPKSSQTSSSPSASPLPTFLDTEFQTGSTGGVKVKIEKDCSPPEQITCSKIKQEKRYYRSCGLSTENDYRETFGPPSNNSSNEDWCAVCHNGGELLCCDTCPKVFHLLCHVPTLNTTPSDSWSCGLCESLDVPVTKVSENLSTANKRRGSIGGMSERDTKVCEKILLELFCHPDSIPFHEKVSKAVPNYYKIIQRPMDLTSIKTKLQPVHFEHYNNINEFIGDCKLIFSNCALFNDADSEVGKMGKRLAADFQSIVRKYLSQYEDDDEPKAKKRKDDII